MKIALLALTFISLSSMASAAELRCQTPNRSINVFGIDDSHEGYVQSEVYDDNFGDGSFGNADCDVSKIDKRGVVAACAGHLDGLNQDLRIRIFKDFLSGQVKGFIQVFKKGTLADAAATFPLICTK